MGCARFSTCFISALAFTRILISLSVIASVISGEFPRRLSPIHRRTTCSVPFNP